MLLRRLLRWHDNTFINYKKERLGSWHKQAKNITVRYKNVVYYLLHYNEMHTDKNIHNAVSHVYFNPKSMRLRGAFNINGECPKDSDEQSDYLKEVELSDADNNIFACEMSLSKIKRNRW